MIRLLRLIVLLSFHPFPPPAPAQTAKDEGTLVIAVARDPASPVPTLWRNDNANRELSDLLFLRLADLGPTLGTGDERQFVPRLARRWVRRDPVTLVFELDPRARWQDGAPVTPADVILALDRARDPKLSPQLATLLRRIQSVTADGDHRVIVKFTEPYAEQLYDVTYHAPPLPSHLLAAVQPESLATSSFVGQPVGNGPYRWVRRTPGQLVEVTANDSFFLGRPKLRRVLFLIAGDPEARVNLLLSGSADATDNIYSLPNPTRLEGLPTFHYYPVPGLALSYITINERDPADTSRPHPILADRVVRQALVQGLDREGMARSTYGPLTRTPGAPVSAILGRSLDAPPAPSYDTAAAARLLTGAGWVDHDLDGVRDKDGHPLSISLLVPAVVAARRLMATRMQEAYRTLGIALQLDLVEPGVYLERRRAGNFDLEFYGVGQDPAPSGLVQSWTCAGFGGSNVGHYCNSSVDSLISRATIAGREAPTLWRDALRRIAADYPAIFIASPVVSFAVHRRFQNVTIRPESAWSTVWQWSVKPGEQIARDTQ
jgi:peptide/nickel transport system substrate-binding protein